VNGNPPLCFGGVFDGGGLSNVTPSTVGDTDGLVSPPPAGALVVPPPPGGLVGPPLAGHASLLDDVVGNSVVLRGVVGTSSSPVKGTMTMPSVESALGAPDGVVVSLGNAWPWALALATKATDAPIASAVLNTNAANVRCPAMGSTEPYSVGTHGAVCSAGRSLQLTGCHIDVWNTGTNSSLTAATSVPFFARDWRAHAPSGATPRPVSSCQTRISFPSFPSNLYLPFISPSPSGRDHVELPLCGG